MRISVIGCGHLGAVHAACMANLGHEVIGIEIDPEKVNLLNQGKSWFHEPGLDQLLSQHVQSGRLHFTTDIRAAVDLAEVHFLGVATPEFPDGSYDLSQVMSAVTRLARNTNHDCLIVGKSTVPPGTTKLLQQVVYEISEYNIEIAWNPEFLREGHAVSDTLRPDRIILGVSSSLAEDTLKLLYKDIEMVPVIVTDPATAELAKVAANSFLAMKVSFINSMADLCVEAGADIGALSRTLGYDPRIGSDYLQAGIGYGGACLQKDVRGLSAHCSKLGVHSAYELLTVIDRINTDRRKQVVRLAENAVGGVLAGKRVAVLGVTFKPGTDDVRDSPGLDIAHRVASLGADVVVYDPKGIGNARKAHPEYQFDYVNSALHAVKDADVVLITTSWPEFRIQAFSAEAKLRVRNPIVVDACQGICAPQWEIDGWQVYSLSGK
jgi:UDPglucose 6-dehydrogenase